MGLEQTGLLNMAWNLVCMSVKYTVGEERDGARPDTSYVVPVCQVKKKHGDITETDW